MQYTVSIELVTYQEKTRHRRHATMWQDIYPAIWPLAYEQFVAKKGVKSQRMRDFLSIDHYPEPGSSNVRITSDDLRGVVKNYDDIVCLLENTEFTYCF